MKMAFRALLYATLLAGLQVGFPGGEVAGSPYSFRSMLKPTMIGSVFISPNQSARSAYEDLAGRTGLNLVFHPEFEGNVLLTMRIEGVDVFDAFDQLSAQTGSFCFPLDSRTLMVAPESPFIRRQIEPTVLSTYYLAPDTPLDVLRKVAISFRGQSGFRSYSAEWSKAFIIRATEQGIADADKLLANASTGGVPIPSSSPVRFLDGSPNFVWIVSAGQVRRFVPSAKLDLEGKLPGSLTIDVRDTPRAIYKDLAQRAGLNILFDRRLKEAPAFRFRLTNVRFMDALDLLGMQSSTIWEPLNESTLLVVPDSPEARRDRVRTSLELIYLPQTVSESDMNETFNVLRTAMALRWISPSMRHRAFLLRGTPEQIFLAEKIVADLVRNQPRPASVALTVPTNSFLVETGWIHRNAERARPLLNVKLRGRTAVHLNTTPKQAFEELGKLAGLDVVFDSDDAGRPVESFDLTSVDILDALDLLGLQTGHLWQVVDDHTIRVRPDTEQIRQEFLPVEQRTIYPPESTTDSVNATINLLRTALSLRDVRADDNNRLVIRDVIDNIALAERVVELLGVPPKQQ